LLYRALDARPLLRGAEGLHEDAGRQALLAGVLILNVALMLLPPLIALLVLVAR
jgi:hypothetical protein